MKLFAYRGKVPNFGDELNFWLWDRLLPGFFDDDDRQIFLGIGSVLHEKFDPTAKKIVFGSGYGGYGTPAAPDNNWQFYFVRGTQTTEALGIDRTLGIGDAGILIRSCWDAADYEKRYDVSFMPHFESAIYGNWEAVCKDAGIHLLDPRLPVEQVLREMSQSRLVISEAMHGVIIADALRVPWRAIRPIDPANRKKWYDWASALGVEIEFSSISPSNIVEAVGGLLHWNRRLRNQIIFRHRALKKLSGNFHFKRAADELRTIAGLRGQLSSDLAIERAHLAMVEKLQQLKNTKERDPQDMKV